MENYNLHRRAQSGWHQTTYSRKPVPDAPRERNYEAILAAAKRPPVGYWEGAPRGMSFGGGKTRSDQRERSAPVACPPAPSSPIPDGARGDVWPKYFVDKTGAAILHSSARGDGLFFEPNWRAVQAGVLFWDEPSINRSAATLEQLLAWLDANGHKAYADSLRQPRKQVEGRVWKGTGSHKGLLIVSQGQQLYARYQFTTEWSRVYYNTAADMDAQSHKAPRVELFGPEADAIIRECAKAMGLDHGTR